MFSPLSFAITCLQHLLVDYAVDFHAGGASRFNALKFRLAQTIQLYIAYVLMHHSLSKMLQDHLETQNHKVNMLASGKSLDINESVTDAGVQGVKRL
jgi:hypothetical protein